ncbi:hypothetical protein SLEP1_g5025 [Rubroshorea leprosula]|uniref:Uncharacterized protein n=1 Tax=Rubroshorea leprosula TaxID=152421 RepID=A0AAV5HZG9_9ROSI|nr:hypothetical protein SLEP1_g5025 [Rubroshorea leprosula]
MADSSDFLNAAPEQVIVLSFCPLKVKNLDDILTLHAKNPKDLTCHPSEKRYCCETTAKISVKERDASHGFTWMHVQ